MTEAAPFIIWTLRRTGGTNLAQALCTRSPFPSSEHEPFNLDRSFGRITRAWLDSRDEAGFRQAIAPIIGQKRLMKHCVETVVGFPNLVLADEAARAGYRHLFLYRRRALDRLMSLEYARRSGVWGKNATPPEVAQDLAFERPLEVAKLVAHEKVCRAQLRAVHAKLVQTGALVRSAAFEDLFENTLREDAARRLRLLLDGFGLARGNDDDDAWVESVLNSGEQGTRDRYARFSNRAALQAALADLGDFDLALQGS